MAISSGYVVPSNHFVVTESEGDSGRWLATVAYRLKDGRTWREIATVTLREMRKGTIELDAGSRDAGGRARTGTHDRQEAVDKAVRQVERMGKAAALHQKIDRTIHAGDDGITMLGAFKVWFDHKESERRSPKKRGVLDETIAVVRQACEIAVNLIGRDFRLAELVGEMDQFASQFVDYRTGGFTFDEELVEKFSLRSSGRRNPAHPNTAAKDIRRICQVIDHVARTRNSKDPERMLLRINPVQDSDFEVPIEQNSSQGKTPISWKTQALLLSPLKGPGGIEPAPLDQVDEDGATRLVAVLMGHQGMRRETPITRQRKHFATAPEEVRQMIKEHGRYLREEDLAEYGRRFWVLHDDTKMEHRDPTHYIRPVPCNRIVEMEIRRYFDRHDLWNADPEAYVVADPHSDRSRPYSCTTFYGSNRYESERDSDGTSKRDKNNRSIPVFDEAGFPIVVRSGGRFARAFDRLRRYLHAQGEDWTKYLPVKVGEALHGYRTNLEESVVKRGWIQVADIEALQDQYDKLNLARYADYLLNRKMHASERNERYALLVPVLLFAVVDHENGLRAAEKLAEQVIEEEAAFMAEMARAAGLDG